MSFLMQNELSVAYFRVMKKYQLLSIFLDWTVTTD